MHKLHNACTRWYRAEAGSGALGLIPDCLGSLVTGGFVLSSSMGSMNVTEQGIKNQVLATPFIIIALYIGKWRHPEVMSFAQGYIAAAGGGSDNVRIQVQSYPPSHFAPCWIGVSSH